MTAYGYDPNNVTTHLYPQELSVMPVARYQTNAPQDGAGYNHSLAPSTQPTGGVALSPTAFPDAPDTAGPANANRTDCSTNTVNNANLGTAGGIKPRLQAEQTLVGNQLTAVAALLPASTSTLTTVAPATGPTAGGTALTLTGTGFAAGATVTVGGRAASSVVVVSATSITCVAPAGECPGILGVSVSGPNGNAYKAASYTYT